MKRKYLIGVVAFIILLAGVGLAGCTPGTPGGSFPSTIRFFGQQQEGIWVNGQGKVPATPDIVALSLGVSAQTATVTDAQSQAATAMDKVMNVLTSNGVAKKDIQTSSFTIQQVTRYDQNKQQEIVTGYRVTNTVTAKIRTLEKTGAIVDAVAVAGGDLTRINSINFSVEDPTKYYQQARELAMKDAKAKADQMAKLAGVTLGKAIYITESSYLPPTPFPVGLAKEAAASAPTTPISPGEMELTVSVQVNYAIP